MSEEDTTGVKGMEKRRMESFDSKYVTFQVGARGGCCGGGGKKGIEEESGCCGGGKAKVSDGGCCGGGGVKESGVGCCGGGSEKGGCCGGEDGQVDYFMWVSLAMLMVGMVVAGMPEVPAWMARYGQTCVELVVKSWWGILFGVVAVAVIGQLPRELVVALLGRGGSVSGLIRAVIAGVALDLCNHGILLVGMGLYRRGASLGQTVAFLIASPWNSFSLTLILAALIGWKWMACFIGLSIVVALATGWVIDRLVTRGVLPKNENEVDLPEGYRVWPEVKRAVGMLMPKHADYRRMMVEGVVGSKMVLRWLFFGFVLTALIRAFVPELIFGHYFGPTLMGVMLTLVATTLIEVCSEGSSPIAADLLLRAHAPGNAFLFLMTGAATDYTEVVSLRATTKSWWAALSLPLISTPQVVALAWLLNHYR